uniref:Uncharacterized protein n=1 Tax=Molossus molossus TaxID=27622 RepID=A0A7J8DBL2_MOLMO|nr:hypothetical protein HJG59_009313 [Molossus molossus]
MQSHSEALGLGSQREWGEGTTQPWHSPLGSCPDSTCSGRDKSVLGKEAPGVESEQREKSGRPQLTERVPSSAAAAGGGKACAAQMWYETAVVNVWKISLSARHSTSHQLPLSWPGKLNVTMIPDLSKRMLVLLQRCSVDVTSIYNRRL